MPKAPPSQQSDHILAPTGNHVARCYSQIHIGTIEDTYMDEEKMVNKIRFTWELCNETHIFKEENGPQPFVVSKEYTFSMNEKANLRKDLESWRGKAFTEEQAEDFNTEKVLSTYCLLNVIHKTSKKNNVYCVISGVTPLPKGTSKPKAVNDAFVWDYEDNFDLKALEDLPAFIKDMVKSSDEWKIKHTPVDEADYAPDPRDEDEMTPVDQESDGDSLPF